MDALERRMQGRTTFIIAHRPSTLQSCDRVLVLDAGRIVKFAAPSSVGSLDELMLSTHAGVAAAADSKTVSDES